MQEAPVMQPRRVQIETLAAQIQSEFISKPEISLILTPGSAPEVARILASFVASVTREGRFAAKENAFNILNRISGFLVNNTMMEATKKNEVGKEVTYWTNVNSDSEMLRANIATFVAAAKEYLAEKFSIAKESVDVRIPSNKKVRPDKSDIATLAEEYLARKAATSTHTAR